MRQQQQQNHQIKNNYKYDLIKMNGDDDNNDSAFNYKSIHNYKSIYSFSNPLHKNDIDKIYGGEF